MPDITMCKGDSCPIREHCYRYTATPDQYQSYFTETPLPELEDGCRYYWPTCPSQITPTGSDESNRT